MPTLNRNIRNYLSRGRKSRSKSRRKVSRKVSRGRKSLSKITRKVTRKVSRKRKSLSKITRKVSRKVSRKTRRRPSRKHTNKVVRLSKSRRKRRSRRFKMTSRDKQVEEIKKNISILMDILWFHDSINIEGGRINGKNEETNRKIKEYKKQMVMLRSRTKKLIKELPDTSSDEKQKFLNEMTVRELRRKRYKKE